MGKEEINVKCIQIKKQALIVIETYALCLQTQ